MCFSGQDDDTLLSFPPLPPPSPPPPPPKFDPSYSSSSLLLPFLTDCPEHHNGREYERDDVLLVPRDVHREGGHQAGRAQRE